MEQILLMIPWRTKLGDPGEPMTYPALRCVVEYLEANKRMYICSRNSRFEKIEKTIPLRLDTLTIYHDGFELNNLQYSLTLYDYSKERESEKLSKVITPGDITLGSLQEGTWTNEPGFVKPSGKTNRYVQVVYDWKKKYIGYELLPCHFEINSALKHLASILFGGRQTIIVKNKFKIDFPEQGCAMRLPESFKVSTKILNVKRHEFIDILPILDSSCFPLKEMKTAIRSEGFYKSPYIRSSQKLVFKRVSTAMERPASFYIAKLPNKELVCDIHFQPIGVMSVINNWLTAGRAEGTKMSVWITKRDQPILWDSVTRTHNAKVIGKKSSFSGSRLLVPMNSTTKLLVYQSFEKEYYGVVVTLEVVSNAAAEVAEVNMETSRLLYWLPFIVALVGVFLAWYFRYRL